MTVTENRPVPRKDWWDKSPESLLPTRRFSPEAAKAIKNHGGIIVTVSGVSVAEQKKNQGGIIIDLTGDKLAHHRSVPAGQYAVFPETLNTRYVEDSFGLNLPEQEKLLPAATSSLQAEIGSKGFRLVVPSAPVVTEIFIKHYLGKTDIESPLFGRRRATNTSTQIGNSPDYNATVGYFQTEHGLFIHKSNVTTPSPEVGMLKVAKPVHE